MNAAGKKDDVPDFTQYSSRLAIHIWSQFDHSGAVVHVLDGPTLSILYQNGGGQNQGQERTHGKLCFIFFRNAVIVTF